MHLILSGYKKEKYVLTLSVSLIIFLFNQSNLCAQDIEQLMKKSKFKIAGGANATQSLYFQDGGANRRDPYNYFLSGRMVASYGSLSVPISFSYSNQRITYGQPFNILGLSPRYKWVTAHLGYRSLNYSPYTLSGHSFLGAGVDVEPIKGWKSSVMYGRLLKAVSPLPNGQNRPSYERYGMGFKTELTGRQGSIGFSIFGAKDNVNSITDTIKEISVTPQQNLVMGLSLLKRLDHWTIRLEGARSALTRDIRSEVDPSKPSTINSIYFIPKHSNTDYFNAFKAQANYQYKSINVGGTFERIDPGFRTLGAYYFNNDLESISLQFSAALFKNRISLAANVGKQRNNLDKTKISTMDRWVTAAQLGFTPSPKLNFNVSFTNFQSFTNVRVPGTPVNSNLIQPTDTLNFVIVSQSLQATSTYMIKATETVNNSIMLSVSGQRAAQITQVNNNYNPTFYNTYLSYNHGFLKRKLQASIGVNNNISGEAEQQTVFLGPNSSLSKTLLKDTWRTQFSFSWNGVWVAGIRSSSVYNLSWNNGYTISKKHNINCTINYLNMSTPTVGSETAYVRSINEVNVQMGYGYTF